MTWRLKSALVGVWIGVQILHAFAETPPSFNVGSSCSGSVDSAKTKETCLAAERAARSELNKTWSKYSARAKIVCTGVVSSGGAQSYVELITCLETMTAANPARKEELSEPTDSKTMERNPIRQAVAKPKDSEIGSARNEELSAPTDSKAMERNPTRQVVAKPKDSEIGAPMLIHPSQTSTREPDSVPPKADGENLLGRIFRSVTGMFGKN
jgi:hypothetical protein